MVTQRVYKWYFAMNGDNWIISVNHFLVQSIQKNFNSYNHFRLQLLFYGRYYSNKIVFDKSN